MVKQRSKSAVRAAPGTQAVVRALAILEALGGASGERGLSELAADLALNKTTVFRLLGALERRGFVARHGTHGAYSLGPNLISLGARASRATSLPAAARPTIERLAALTGETVTLEVLVGDEVLIMDEVRGRFLVRTMPEVGMRWPAHATSTGKALLAAGRFGPGAAGARPASAGAAAAAPRLERLERLTPATITTRERLDEELADVWHRGFAVANEELEPGFIAVGAAVTGVEGRAVAAVSVGGPVARIGVDRTGALGALVRDAANEISRRLGAALPDS